MFQSSSSYSWTGANNQLNWVRNQSIWTHLGWDLYKQVSGLPSKSIYGQIYSNFQLLYSCMSRWTDNSQFALPIQLVYKKHHLCKSYTSVEGPVRYPYWMFLSVLITCIPDLSFLPSYFKSFKFYCQIWVYLTLCELECTCLFLSQCPCSF